MIVIIGDLLGGLSTEIIPASSRDLIAARFVSREIPNFSVQTFDKANDKRLLTPYKNQHTHASFASFPPIAQASHTHDEGIGPVTYEQNRLYFFVAFVGC